MARITSLYTGLNRAFSIVVSALLVVALSLPQAGLAYAAQDLLPVKEETLAAQDAQTTVVYTQEDGYEPYTGWQDAPWQEAGDPQYTSQGGATSRKGYPAWSLCNPLSQGVTDYANGELTTGTDVEVVTDKYGTLKYLDTNPDDATYDAPTYYKNIILDSYDVSASSALTFTFNTVAPGGSGLSAATVLALEGSGFVVATSPDPYSWEGDDSTVVWTAGVDDVTCSQVRDNWWQYVNVNVPTTALEAGKTYYFAVLNGTASGWGRIYANIVFEFSTDVNRTAQWQGDKTAAAYGREQGNGGTKLGFTSPSVSSITTDLTKTSYAYYNVATETVKPNAAGNVVFRVHTDGSGSNFAALSDWNSSTGVAGSHVAIYATDPLKTGVFNVEGLTPVCSYELGNLTFANTRTDRDWPGLDGVDISAEGLRAGATYYLVFDSDFKCTASSTNALDKPIILKFTVDGQLSWDVSADQDGSVTASIVALDNDTYSLNIQGTGAMADYASAAAVPYMAAYGEAITQMVVGEGVTNIGAYAAALPALAMVSAGSTLTSVDDNAFEGAYSLVAADFSAASLTSVAANAFGAAGSQTLPKRTIYVKDAASAQAMTSYTSDAVANTAVAVMNGGSFAQDTTFEAGTLATPARDGYTFSTWTNDADLMHPTTAWESMAEAFLYARFVEVQKPDEPEEYQGAQGLDQTVTLYDVAQLPSLVTNTDVLFYGEEDTYYDNRFQTAFNGRKDIVFAFGMGRGTNANNGDGSYQLSFSLPYVSIVDANGQTVASYDNGNGLLRLINIVFDGVEGKTTGRTIYAVRIGVSANQLPAGEYTLRFGKDFGANNGISFLQKDVDFTFTVEYPEEYTLHYTTDAAAKTAAVSGITVAEGVTDLLDVIIPRTVTIEGVEYAVTAVASDAFKDADQVASVDAPETVTQIGAGAFSGMANLSKVTVRAQGGTAIPTWGKDVFANTASAVSGGVCTLYGYANSSALEQANSYANVVFAGLDDGLYVNDTLLGAERSIQLTSALPTATLRIMKDGQDVTANYTGALTNTNVVSHGGTGSFAWNTLAAQANGTAQLVITGVDGTVYSTVSVEVSGMGADASSEAVALTTYQGNGATIQLSGVGALTTKTFDETKDYFDNYITEAVPAETASFTFELGGPGSAWGPGHSGWNWAGFVANINANLALLDAQGQTIATIGQGLTWTSLTKDNIITVAVDPGILEPGQDYVLVAGAGFSGHNVAATLMKAVHWSFTAGTTPLSACTVSELPAQTWTGNLLEPKPTVTLTYPDIIIWNDDAATLEITPGAVRTLTEGTDYAVTYEAGETPGQNLVVLTGSGKFGSTTQASFAINQRLFGDLNANSKVNIVDVQLAFDAATQGLEDAQVARIIWALSDINADAAVDAADARALQFIVMQG